MNKNQNKQPQTVVNITPVPLPDAPAYLVAKRLSDAERMAFRLAWERMCREEGTKRLAILLPEGTELSELSVPLLQQLRKQIDEVLKERGAHDVPRL